MDWHSGLGGPEPKLPMPAWRVSRGPLQPQSTGAGSPEATEGPNRSLLQVDFRASHPGLRLVATGPGIGPEKRGFVGACHQALQSGVLLETAIPLTRVPWRGHNTATHTCFPSERVTPSGTPAHKRKKLPIQWLTAERSNSRRIGVEASPLSRLPGQPRPGISRVANRNKRGSGTCRLPLAPTPRPRLLRGGRWMWTWRSPGLCVCPERSCAFFLPFLSHGNEISAGKPAVNLRPSKGLVYQTGFQSTTESSFLLVRHPRFHILPDAIPEEKCAVVIVQKLRSAG